MIEQIVRIVEQARDDILRNYNEMGLRASGEFERQLEIVKEEGRIRLLAAPHSWYMENGRGAGKAPPREVILQWIRDKSLVFEGITDNQAAYLICRKIAREGITVPNPYNPGGVISNILDADFEMNLKEKVGEAIKEIVIKNLKA